MTSRSRQAEHRALNEARPLIRVRCGPAEAAPTSINANRGSYDFNQREPRRPRAEAAPTSINADRGAHAPRQLRLQSTRRGSSASTQQPATTHKTKTHPAASRGANAPRQLRLHPTTGSYPHNKKTHPVVRRGAHAPRRTPVPRGGAASVARGAALGRFPQPYVRTARTTDRRDAPRSSSLRRRA